jgi:hypothetical protein
MKPIKRTWVALVVWLVMVLLSVLAWDIAAGGTLLGDVKALLSEFWEVAQS